MNPSAERECVRRWIDPGAAPKGRAEVLLRSGRPALAAAAVESDLAGRPDDLQSLCLAGLARLSTGDFLSAKGFFERAAAAHPKSALAAGLKGFLIDGRENPEAARRALERALRLSPKAGWPLALRSQLRESLEDLTEAVKREPEPWIFLLRARRLDKLGRMEEALADLDVGLKRAPGHAGLHALRGHCLFHRKQYEPAVAAFTRALRAAPGDAAIWRQRADAWWLLGRHDAAARDLKRCVALEPDSFTHRLDLARLQVLTGRGAAALGLLSRWQASGEPEKEAGASFLKGMFEFRRRKFRAAAAEFSRAEALARAGRYPGRFVDAGYSQMARGFEFMRRHRPGKEITKKGAALVLSGLGLDYPYQATLETLKALSECDILVNNLAGAEAMDFLRLYCKDVRTISFEGVESTRWADKIIKWLKPGRKVGFVTRGHPLVSGHLALNLLQKARKERIPVRCYGAISSVDHILALTEEVLSETYWGIQALDSQLLLAGKTFPQTGLPAILYLNARPGAGAQREAIRRICGLLLKEYGAGHRLRVFGPRYDSRQLQEVPVGGLEKFLRAVAPNMFSSMILLLPPVKNLTPNPDRRIAGRDDGAGL